MSFTKQHLKKLIEATVRKGLKETHSTSLLEASTKTDKEIQKVLTRWVEQDLQSPPGPHWFPPRELFKYREFMRPNRPDLQKSMKAKGFDPKYPIRLKFGKNGEVKVHEGNHRLKTAIQLGIEKVPVVYDFGKVVKKWANQVSDLQQKKDKKILRQQQADKRHQAMMKKWGGNTKPKKSEEPEDPQQLQDLMDLLFSKF